MQANRTQQITSHLILSFIIISQSCIEKVDYTQIKTPVPKLVVNSYITPDSFMEFFVNKTSGMIDTSFYIENGSIELFENDVLIATLLEHEKGHFVSSLKPKIDHEYRIIVNADNMKVTAQTTIPGSTEISDLAFIYPAGEAFDTYFVGKYAKLFITIDDLEKENYYEMVVFGYNPDTKKYTKGYIRSNNFIIMAEGESYTTQKLLFSDNMFNGQKIVLDVETLNTSYSRPLIVINSHFTVVVLRTVSKEYYQYHKTLLAHYYNQELIALNSMEATARMQFTGTPVDVYSNIEDGYGVFAGYSTYTYVMDNYPDYP